MLSELTEEPNSQQSDCSPLNSNDTPEIRSNYETIDINYPYTIVGNIALLTGII